MAFYSMIGGEVSEKFSMSIDKLRQHILFETAYYGLIAKILIAKVIPEF